MRTKRHVKGTGFLQLLAVFVMFVGVFVTVMGFDLKFGAAAKQNPPNKWYVSMGLLGAPTADFDTAREMLNTLTGVGIPATEVDRFLNGGWNAHLLAFPPTLNNFSIEPGVGYLVMIDPMAPKNILNWKDLLQEKMTNLQSVSWRVGSGYNYVSLPSGVLGRLGQTNSENLCQIINAKLAGVFRVDEVNRLKSNPYPYRVGDNVWTTYVCGSNSEAFLVKSGNGYMLKLTRLDGQDGVVSVNLP